MKLNVYLAKCGVASRRKSGELIKKGAVKVNGKSVKEPFFEVKSSDSVFVYGKKAFLEKKVYIALNKPEGYTATVKDPFAEKKVTDLIPRVYGRLFPVGRLDKNSSGLLLMTNDGEFANRITHPKYGVEKEYRIVVSPAFKSSDLKNLKAGIEDENELLRAAYARKIKAINGGSILSVVMKEGKKREVRRMFSALGYRVISLVRVRVGSILLGRLKPGQHRKLTPKEIKENKE